MVSRPSAPPRTVDEYFARLTPEAREPLLRLRRIIRSAAPKAEEVISYQIPAFRQNGLLVYYAAFEDHFSFFPGSVKTTRKFTQELKPFAVGKGTFHFTRDRQLPADLVRRIVRARVSENERRTERKAPTRRGMKRTR